MAVTHRQANGIDSIEIGSMWQTGHVTEKAMLGDWWLSLPAEAPVGNAPAPDKQDAPADYAGKVTHDLIQADGVRIIEAGEFTIRVGKDKLGTAGERPKNGVPGGLSIEHSSGAKVVIDKDGNITIQAASGKDLNLEAKDVNVKCEKMNVS